MDEKLKTEDLITTHNNINTDELLEITQHNHNALNRNNLNNTKYLLKSSVNGLSQIKSLNNKDNTLQLINDKTSLLYESKKKRSEEDIVPTEDLLRNNDEMDMFRSGKSDVNKFSNNFSNFSAAKNRGNQENEDFDLQCKTSFLLEETDNKLLSKLNRIYDKKSKSDENDENVSLSISEDRRETQQVFLTSPDILKFPLAFPGETLKTKFKVTNLLNHKIYLDFSFVLKEKNIIKDIEKAFSQYKDVINNMENSQAKYNCFKINQSNSEEIAKKQEIEYEVELNSPQIKAKEDLFALLQISCNFNDKTTYFFLPILAYVEMPKLLCLKELYSEKCNFPLIAIMLKTQTKGQKVKIPFRNFSLKDLEIEFYFERNSGLQNKVFVNNQLYDAQFVCFPSNLVISSHATAFLELVVKVLKAKQDENIEILKNKNLIRKVLIAKVKNANAYYTFFLEASFN